MPKPKKPKTGSLADDLANDIDEAKLPKTNAEKRKAFAGQLWMGQVALCPRAWLDCRPAVPNHMAIYS